MTTFSELSQEQKDRLLKLAAKAIDGALKGHEKFGHFFLSDEWAAYASEVHSLGLRSNWEGDLT